jgi:hypothetical protein
MLFPLANHRQRAWVPIERAYGFFRKDVPGRTKQVEIRCPLGFCRDRMRATLKLHQVMQPNPTPEERLVSLYRLSSKR